MLTCPCRKTYIGQTKRALKACISEHETAIRTGNLDYAMAKHYIEAKNAPPFVSLALKKSALPEEEMFQAIFPKERCFGLTASVLWLPQALMIDFTFLCEDV